MIDTENRDVIVYSTLQTGTSHKVHFWIRRRSKVSLNMVSQRKILPLQKIKAWPSRP